MELSPSALSRRDQLSHAGLFRRRAGRSHTLRNALAPGVPYSKRTQTVFVCGSAEPEDEEPEASGYGAVDGILLVSFRQRRSRHAAWHEASNRQAFTVSHGPHHRPADFIGHGDNGIVRNVNPLIFDADSVVSAVRFPVGIINHITVSNRAT